MSGELLSQDIAEAKMEGFQSYKKVDDVEQLWMYRTKDDETGARLDAWCFEICKYAGMQVCKYSMMNECANVQVW